MFILFCEDKCKCVMFIKFVEMCVFGELIVMIMVYDYLSAFVVEQVGVDVVFVGDFVVNNVFGYFDMVFVMVDEMLMFMRAVCCGLEVLLLVGDLLFGFYEVFDVFVVEIVQCFVKEVGCDGVKFEGGGVLVEWVCVIVCVGVLVMGYVGFILQIVMMFGGYCVQGCISVCVGQVFDDVLVLQEVGCFVIVFEVIFVEVIDMIMDWMEILVVGIGVGFSMDGQVFVLYDLLVIYDDFQFKFVKWFAVVKQEMLCGVEVYVEEVWMWWFLVVEYMYGIVFEELECFWFEFMFVG